MTWNILRIWKEFRINICAFRTRSSVLVNSIQSFSAQPSDPSRLQSNTAGLNPQQSNTADLSAFPAVFTPAQLNLEETASPDEMVNV